jgi:catechol 2,3-dioxygenase-like lactoylglutathione lyase family enzyme
MSVSLQLLVLRCADPAASVAFYEGIGLSFHEERHGQGPIHHSARLGDAILELYPIGRRPRAVRLRLVVSPAVYDAFALRAGGSASPSALVVEDPDQNQIELVRAKVATRELAEVPATSSGRTQAFELWLEFEHWVPTPDDDLDDDFFNMAITLQDGAQYALNVWTYRALDSIRRDAARTGDHLAGRYLEAPDLFVARMDRDLIEAVVADMIARKTLKQEWLAPPEPDTV